jgi:outer membrane protein TolC
MAAFKYWEWVAAGKKLKVAEDLLGISLVRDKALIDRVRHGDTPQIDQTDNQRAVVQRRSAVLAAERLLQKASFELSLYLRDDSGNPRVVLRENLPADFPEPVVDEVEKTVVEDRHWISQHPEVERLRIQIEQAQLEYRLAANQLLPKLDFNFGVYKDFGVNPGTSPYLTAYSNLNEIRLGLSLEFPLFFRTPRGKLESASLVVNKLGVIRGLAQDRIQVILNDSRQAMKTALERLAFARKEISLNQKLEEAERVRFKHGDSNVLMINIREQITCDAWFKEYDALVDFYKAKAEFSAAQGSSS